MSRRSKKRAKQAVPEEILAEGSGPNETVEADVQTLADAAAEALAPAEVADVEAEVEAVAMAAEVVVVAAEAARAEAGESKKDRKAKKKGKKAAPAEAEVALDAWGQPIIVEPEAAAATDDELAAASDEAHEGVAEATSDEDMPAIAPDEGVAASDEAGAVDTASELAPTIGDEVSEPAFDEELAADATYDDEVAADDSDAVEMAADDLDESDADADSDEGSESDEGDIEGVMPTSAASMDAAELKHLVEALVFASDKPVTIQRLRQLTRISDVRRLEAALAELNDDYKARGIALQIVSGGYQFRTNTTYAGWVQQLIAGRPVRLSRAQLETLAIVAYRQPITRPEIDDIRGVDSSSTLKVLLDRSLIRILGKREEAGRPTLYGTTKEFLDFFSLGDLRELPTLREYSELTAESRKVVSERLGVSLDGAPADAPSPDGEVSFDADGEPSAEAAEPTMDDALRAYVGDADASSTDSAETTAAADDAEAGELSADADIDTAAAERATDARDAESPTEFSAESHAEESTERSADSHEEELSADSHVEPSTERSLDSHEEELSADSHVETSTELPGDPHVEELSADARMDEASTDSHVEESSADFHAEELSSELSDTHMEESSAELLADSHVEEPSAGRLGDAHVEESSAELAADALVEDASALSADATPAEHAAAPTTESDASEVELGATGDVSAGHGFIDPEELAGRVVSGENDLHASGGESGGEPEGGHALETGAAEDAEGLRAADPEEQNTSESDGTDASAHDDPAVD